MLPRTKQKEYLHEIKVLRAHEIGFYDAFYNGADIPASLPCQCPECVNAYANGQADANAKKLEHAQKGKHA